MAIWGSLIGAGLNYALQPHGSSGYQMADPFASQRGQYQQQLQRLMTQGIDPNDPAYRASMTQGMDAIQRSQAAKGMLGSGNTMAELQQFGSGLAAQQFQSQYDRLAELSGARSGSPASAGQLYQQQQQLQAAGAGILGKYGYQALHDYFTTPDLSLDLTPED